MTVQRALAQSGALGWRPGTGGRGQGRTTNGIDESPLTRNADSMRFGAGGWEQEVRKAAYS